MIPGAQGFPKLRADRFVDLDLTSEDLRQNYRSILAEWAKQPPFYVMQSGSPQAVACRFYDVREVLTNRDLFSSVPPASATGKFQKFMPSKFMTVTPPTQMEGPRHSRIRRLINPAFTPQAVAQYQTQIQGMIAELILDLRAKGPLIDAMESFAAHLMPRALLACVFHFTPAQQDIFVAMNDALKLTTRLRPGEEFPAAYVEIFNKAEVVINEIIAERRANPGDDLISKLILVVDEGDSLTSEELFELVFVFGAGALDSTASTMGGALYSLVSHPEQLQDLKHNLDLIPTALEECFRYHGTGFLLFTRYALKDTELNGVPLLAGMPVYVCHHAASMDPDVYPDPLRFDIRRNPANVTLFGGGVHHCVGHRLAKMVLASALEQMLRAFPDLRLADERFHPVYQGATSETLLTELPLRLW
jgi:cytochrome P450